MNVELSRRQFLGGTGAVVAASALGSFGFGAVMSKHRGIHIGIIALSV
ncbi:MAG: twin-arginine translocation signal domain-containing protein, partial [Brucella intermedia]